MGWRFSGRLERGEDLVGWVFCTISFFESLVKPQPKIKVTHRGGSRRPSQKATARKASTKQAASQTPQSEIDAILDKISDKGYESLSKEEKQKLFNASKK